MSLGKETILFKPEDGIYNMAVGKEVVSAFAGAADISSFQDESEVSKTKTRKIRYTDKEKELYALYEEVREMREANNVFEKNLIMILDQLKKDFPHDWLLSLELYEVALQFQFLVEKEILKYLLTLQKNEKYSNLIINGLNLLKVKKSEK